MALLNAHVPLDLIEELEVRFPPRCIQPKDDINQAFFYAGGVSMVEYLRLSYEAQRKAARELSSPIAGLPPLGVPPDPEEELISDV